MFINNLFRRSKISGTSAATNCALSLTNNLIWSANVILSGPSNNLWQAYNNAFDSCASLNGLHFTNSNGNNAYLNTGGRINPTNGTEVISTNTMAYLSGPLGDYYQPTSSVLINMGNTSANLLGLYHYTTQTNEVKETTSIVDIGYHYVAVDGNGNPIDTVGSGVPDYLKDANGNGSVDSGEINWNDKNDLGLKVLITRPKNNSTIP